MNKEEKKLNLDSWTLLEFTQQGKILKDCFLTRVQERVTDIKTVETSFKPYVENEEADKFVFNAKNNNMLSLLNMIHANPKIINVYDKTEKTALHWAVKWLNVNMAEMLLMKKADMYFKDLQGHSPLDYVKKITDHNMNKVFKEAKLGFPMKDSRHYEKLAGVNLIID